MMNNSQGASSFFSGLSTLLGRPHPLLHNLSDTTSGRSIPFILICIFGDASTEIAAQDALAFEPGVRVRVTALECGLRERATRYVAFRADTLVLETTECPIPSVTRFDVSRGRRSHVPLGIGIGLAAGALGTVVYCSGDRFEFSDEGKCELYDSDFTLLATALIGAAGGLVGGIAGHFIKTDRWEEVPLERLRVSLAPQRDGRIALGFSIRF